MIATTTNYWLAFFDPDNIKHKKTRDSILLYDKEQIIIDQIVISQVTNWLFRNNKNNLVEWFLDYVQNTSNVKIYYFGREEFRIITRTCIEKKMNFSEASAEYLQKYLNCDITKEF